MAFKMICGVYGCDEVFRIGGDEFVVVLEGECYQKRDALLASNKELSLKITSEEEGIVIAAGMAMRRKSETFHEVFRRADKQMYTHKNPLKKKRPDHNLR